MKIINIVGARPNFVKIAPIIEEMKKRVEIESILVHTGQHYNPEMSKLFFEDLDIPEPDIYLEVGSASHAVQTAEIMKRFEPVAVKERPDLVLVVGDVNSTIACALVSVKLGVPVAHVEAGLRSFDRSMPEEINRVLTDSIAQFHFTTEKDANLNLIKEGIHKEKIFFVGNVMIDSLLKHKDKAKESKILEKLNLEKEKYAVLTLHRPSNVDNKNKFLNLIEALKNIAMQVPVIFPAHPRTIKQIEEFALYENFIDLRGDNKKKEKERGIFLIDPMAYLDFLQLMSNSLMVLTDSGGMQEETTVLGVPCITLRKNTERPITVKQGTNIVAGNDKFTIIKRANEIIKNKKRSAKAPKYWDGCAAKRIVDVLEKNITNI